MMNGIDWHYRCESCGRTAPLDTSDWRCSHCDGAFGMDGFGALRPEAIPASDRSLWRYQHVLPVPLTDAVTLGEGMTPLVRGMLAETPVWFKLDYLLPTGSFKDRGAAVLVSHLRRLGHRRSAALFALLVGGGYATVAAAATLGGLPPAALLCLLSAPLAWPVVNRVVRSRTGDELVDLPLRCARLHLVFSLFYAGGLIAGTLA